MSIFERALAKIEEGKAGLNVGIPIGFSRLREYLPNIQQKTTYLIGAGTKVGKTSFADDVFFYGAYDYFSNLKAQAALEGFELDIDYFTFEIDSETKIIKGITRKIWLDYGIVVDSNTILSRGENHCSDEIYNIVLSTRKYFEELEEICTMHSMPDNPTGIYKYLWDKAKRHGTIIEKNVNEDPNGEKIMRFDKYIPNNPKRYWLVFLDHIALMLEERGFNTKQNIDKMSQYFVQLRNNFNMTPIIIQQLTFDTDNDDRYKSNRLTPTLRDFGDSKYTTRDANVIMALFSPYRHHIEEFGGYDVRRLGNSFRNCEILENRDGEPNINIGLNFIGPAGTFREMPRASEMNDAYYHNCSNYINGKPNYVQNNSGLWIPNPKLV